MTARVNAVREFRELRSEPLAWVCVPLIVVGFGLMFINLGSKPFWADESIAVLPAKSIHSDLLPTSPFDLDFMPWQLEYGLWDPATPLYRYAVAAFTALTGFSEFTARAFSVLMGLALTIPFYALAKRLYDQKTALLATAFLVTSSSFMIYAREARHFTFVAFLALCSLYYLYSAAENRRGGPSSLWFVFLIATLLSQTLGYALLPVVGLYLLLHGPGRFFARKHLVAYLLAGAVYLVVFALFWNTLPFFHITSCSNRPSGCQESPWYYLGVLYEFLAPMRERHPHDFWNLLSVPPLFFLLGLVLTLRSAVTRRTNWEKASLILVWLLVPLLLLSLSEVKFPRYLFIWSMPLCALLTAVAVRWVATLPALRARPSLVLTGLVLLVVLSPQLTLRSDRFGPAGSVRSGLFTYLESDVVRPRTENWERMRWQAEYLNSHMAPEDIVVTTLDDASLQYYLGRFVYGFLNSRRTDEFFLGILEDAEQRGAKLWLIDTLPHSNFCLSDEPEPRSVDCRLKYKRFYEKCSASDDRASPACVRVPVYGQR